VSGLVLQGVASDAKPFVHGDNIVVHRAGCFTESLRNRDVRLLLNHDDAHCLGSTRDQSLLIHEGDKGIVFRFLLPDSFEAKFADMADDFSSYIPVSIGYRYAESQTKTEVINGINCVTILEAKFDEISLLDLSPAIHSTYARVATWETCNGLKEDYELGRFELVGRYVSLHRAVKAKDNGGVVNYAHATKPYDRAADRFVSALKRLGNT
jgi:HK97 family phage prohead protease